MLHVPLVKTAMRRVCSRLPSLQDVAFYVSPLAYIRRQSVNEPQEAEIACAASPCSQLATVQNERKLLHLREVLRSRVKGSQLDSLKQLVRMLICQRDRLDKQHGSFECCQSENTI